MAVDPLYLADKSALARLAEPQVRERLPPCSSRVWWQRVRSSTSKSSTVISGGLGDRTLEVQHELARRGHHRIALPDLLVAAVAEINDLRVMHYDADFDRIAGITLQPAEWVVALGSV